jgi:DNA-binding response OmpR family regulator
LSAQTLLDLAWSDPFGIGPERVKYAVMRLRRKLAAQEETGDSPIEAVRGFGYRYRASPGQHQRGSPPRPADSSPGRYGPLTPATGPHPASHAVATAAGHAMAMTPTAATRGRILLVEDDPDAATFFRDVLTGRDDYQVTHTADPAQALCLAEREPWDLLLTDFHLPGMTGLELLIAVRLVRPALPVVIVTADDPGLLRLPCGSPDALLHKPVPAGFLLSTVATLLARHRTAEPGSRTPGGASAPST